MTTDRHAARRAVALVTVIVLSLVAAFTLSTGPASADTATLAGTRVAASTHDLSERVRPVGHVVAGEGRETAAGSYDFALGCCVATRAPGGGAGRLTDPNPSPYQVHIDPRTGRGPMGIDTSGYKGTATANGGVRNSRAFWDDWAEAYPDTLSPANQARVSGPRPRSPQVDDQWVQHFPETGGSRGETLVHHHLDCGPTAIPLPQSVHGNTPGFGIWHAGC